ncbi:hypothetical protein Dda_8263 [Drechslerella dactyloides]|uniref:Uncharacterized protein n=1 Tax=Drechslerella dactyloides TaxID=74499 RepID=A0AAD6ISW4_DREDA|nr:hypothetical protein Dda_8263 [Drechslerella dactyloides]
MSDTTAHEFEEELKERLSFPEYDYKNGDLATGINVITLYFPAIIDNAKQLIASKSIRVKAIGSGVITTILRKRRPAQFVFEKVKERLIITVDARDDFAKLRNKIKNDCEGKASNLHHIAPANSTVERNTDDFLVGSIVELIEVKRMFEDVSKLLIKGHEALDTFMENCYNRMEAIMDKHPELGPPEFLEDSETEAEDIEAADEGEATDEGEVDDEDDDEDRGDDEDDTEDEEGDDDNYKENTSNEEYIPSGGTSSSWEAGISSINIPIILRRHGFYSPDNWTLTPIFLFLSSAMIHYYTSLVVVQTAPLGSLYFAIIYKYYKLNGGA